MLIKLLLNDFQGHEHTVLEFDPHVNVIVGQSDVGKSAILRALWWLFKGHPTGDSIIRKGRHMARVTAVFDDNRVTRTRADSGKEKTKYYINGELLKAMGLTVPNEVIKAMNLADINFTRQMDGPFLLSMSPMETAAYLNEIVDLEIITKTLKNMQTCVFTINRDIKNAQQKVEKIKENLVQYDWLKEADFMCKEYEKIYEKIMKKKQEVFEINSTVCKLQEILKKKGEYGYLKELTDYVKNLEECAESIEKQKKFTEDLLETLSDIDAIENKQKSLSVLQVAATFVRNLVMLMEKISYETKQVNDLESLLKQTQQLEVILNSDWTVVCASYIKYLDDILKGCRELSDNIKELSKIINEYFDCVHARTGCEAACDAYERTLKEEMPDVCPFCGKEL